MLVFFYITYLFYGMLHVYKNSMINEGRNSGAVVSIVTSQQEGSGLYPSVGLSGISLWSSSHAPLWVLWSPK